MAPTKQQVFDSLAAVAAPDGRKITETGALSDIVISDGKVFFSISVEAGAVEAWERAYTAYRRAGLDEPAAHVAVFLSREHAEGLGNDALANGWLARARDLLGDHPDSIEWGWVALAESERAVDPTPRA